MGVPTRPIRKTSTCLTLPSRPLTSLRSAAWTLGLEVTGQRLDPDRAALACRVVDDDQADQSADAAAARASHGTP